MAKPRSRPDSKKTGRRKKVAPGLVARAATSTSGDDPRRLLHELQVHQIEIEVQNREVRETRALLEESRARYAELYDRAPVAYLTLDLRGTIVAANLSAGNLLSRERHALIGQYFRSFLTRGTRQKFDAHLARSTATDLSGAVEVRVPFPEGERTIELVTAPFVGSLDHGRVCHLAAIDVTVRTKEAQQRSELLDLAVKARTLAESANTMKEEFLAVVSHELRTPLAPMLMWLKVLETSPDDAAMRARAIQSIGACARAQTALIDDLVDAARGTHGKLQIERRPLDLSQVVDEVVERSSMSAANKNVHIRRSPSNEPYLVSGDKDRLRQVISNVLANAIKFSRERGSVELSLRHDATSIVLTVRDEGEGIDAGLLPLLFQRFRQGEHTQVRRHGGLGLGLFIAQQIVAQHDGTIEADSEGRGHGATFTIKLPRVEGLDLDAVASDGHPAVPANGAGADRRPLANVRVLLVDDHAPTREAVATVLQQYGARIAVADSAEQGRAAMGRARPDVLISDLAMPGEDGHTFMRTLRAAEAAAPDVKPVAALALSAHATGHHRQSAMDAGFDRYLAKPIEADRLVAMVAQLAGRRRLETPPGIAK